MDGKNAQDDCRRFAFCAAPCKTRETSGFGVLIPAFLVAFLLAMLFPLGDASIAVAVESSPPPVKSPSPLILDDAPLPLKTKQPLSEAESDRLEAIARFSAGVMHERRGEFAEALRYFERAFRLDPKSSNVLRSVITVAVRLKHYAEAVRYALKSVELDDADPIVLRGLGGYLSEAGDWVRAVALYEKAVAIRGKSHEIASDILMRMEMGGSTTSWTNRSKPGNVSLVCFSPSTILTNSRWISTFPRFC